MKKKYTQKKKAAKKKNTNLKGDSPKIAVLSRDSDEYIEHLLYMVQQYNKTIRSGVNIKSAKNDKKNIELSLLQLFCEAVREDETPHPLLIKHVGSLIAKIYGINIGKKNEYKQSTFDSSIKSQKRVIPYSQDPRTVFPKEKINRISERNLHLAFAVQQRIVDFDETQIQAIRHVRQEEPLVKYLSDEVVRKAYRNNIDYVSKHFKRGCSCIWCYARRGG